MDDKSVGKTRVTTALTRDGLPLGGFFICFFVFCVSDSQRH